MTQLAGTPLIEFVFINHRRKTMKADQVAVKAKEEFDDMVDETALSDYAVNEVDLGEIEINGKKMTVYLGIRQD
ncbi:hypothetical protein Q8E16_000996 [Vibrio alginolyticus]|uniref:hypothetical protein n=1 Tax=Vibrio alginolyticus TaxID=663 RepID=UPI001B8452FF|nr:hypothetical protein [Vibrio alginolyticus]HBC3490716.1 hypothetical protein [Vibrio alginolyticus]